VLDIKAFGKISELGSEDDFRNFLIDYRTITTGIITRRGGFIESWSADECTAIFGAPVPLKNDALQAALSAVEIKKAAESHTEAWRHKFGIEKVRVGIGISRGKIISSDFGLGFGFAGSAIEGAKQLNRLNRLYKTWGLASGTVVSETEKELEYRTLDPVKIWGIQNPSVIFEIVGESGTLLPSIRGYEEARDAYLQGNFTKAAELFSRILEFHPNDGPSKLFCRRSIAMASNPPEKWGGVWKQ
jgi:class 3 adenylate cyclase